MGAKARLTQSHAGRQAGPSNQPACAEAFFGAMPHPTREARGLGWSGAWVADGRKKHGGDGSEVGRSGSAHVVRTLMCARRRYLTRVGGWWVVVMVVMVGVVVVVAVEVLLVVVEAVAGGRERQLVAGQSVRGGRQRGAAVAVRCVLRLQQQCSVQCAVCSTAGAGTETGGRHGCDAVAMHASRYADVMQQKRRRAVVVLPGLGDGLSAAAGCRCWLLAATAIS